MKKTCAEHEHVFLKNRYPTQCFQPLARPKQPKNHLRHFHLTCQYSLKFWQNGRIIQALAKNSRLGIPAIIAPIQEIITVDASIDLL
jgi:hypothetical protein